jgi:hypothetical protein
MSYRTRYMKEHYVKRNIRRDIYEEFIRWCGEPSINRCLEKVLSMVRAGEVGG